jgi:transposase-like protein
MVQFSGSRPIKGRQGDSRKRFTAEQIIGKLREAEVALAQGQTTGQVCRTLGIAEQTFYRWRREYGGLKVDQAKRLKALEQENARLRRAVSDLTLDKLILQEAVRGNF